MKGFDDDLMNGWNGMSEEDSKSTSFTGLLSIPVLFIRNLNQLQTGRLYDHRK